MRQYVVLNPIWSNILWHPHHPDTPYTTSVWGTVCTKMEGKISMQIIHFLVFTTV